MDRVLAERARVEEYREDGFYRVVNLDKPEDLAHGVFWLRPNQCTPGTEVGSTGKVLYYTDSRGGHAFFRRES